MAPKAYKALKEEALSKSTQTSDKARTDGVNDNDIVIPIVGQTGSGRSTFINSVAGRSVAKVGNDMDPCTTDIQPLVVPYPADLDRRIVLVDTPGFNIDDNVDEVEILKRVAVWLGDTYSNDMKIAGIICTHDISQCRMTPRDNVAVFKELSSEDGLKNVILATTRWSDVEPVASVKRERELINEYWKDMLDHGSNTIRFTDTPQSAWDIVKIVLKNLPENGANAREIDDATNDLLDSTLLIHPFCIVANDLRDVEAAFTGTPDWQFRMSPLRKQWSQYCKEYVRLLRISRNVGQPRHPATDPVSEDFENLKEQVVAFEEIVSKLFEDYTEALQAHAATLTKKIRRRRVQAPAIIAGDAAIIGGISAAGEIAFLTAGFVCPVLFVAAGVTIGIAGAGALAATAHQWRKARKELNNTHERLKNITDSTDTQSLPSKIFSIAQRLSAY